MKTTTQKIIMTSLFAALTCVATMILKIPSPLNGYINLGDCIVLLSAWLLPIGYALLAAGLGSALADIFSGYVIYAPATFIIKALMAVVAYSLYVILSRRMKSLPSRILSGTLAELIMIFGYFLFEGILYGFSPSVVNILPNAIQGVVGLVLGIILIKIFEKQKFFKQ